MPQSPVPAALSIAAEGRLSSPRRKAIPAPEMISPRPGPRVRMEESHLVTLWSFFSPFPPALLPSEARDRCRRRDQTITRQSGGAAGCGLGIRIAQTPLGVLAQPLAAKLAASHPTSPRPFLRPQYAGGNSSCRLGMCGKFKNLL